jgi:hypothetical protein
MKRIAITAVFMFVIMGSACQPAVPPANDSLIASSTAAMKTVEVLGTKLAGVVSATSSVETSTPTGLVSPSATILPSATKSPSRTPTIFSTPAIPWNSCDAAEFLSETIVDQARIAPGTEFVKTWTLRNVGTCTWTKEYRLVFESGESMTSSTSVAFVKDEVTPGDSVTMSVKMTAPELLGEHVGFWKLINVQGLRFGIGGEGKAFYTQIIVEPETKDDFAVISAPVFTAPTTYKGSCGKNGIKIYFTGKIKTNKSGTVKYHWEDKESTVDNSIKEITFYGADQVTVSASTTIRQGYHEEWIRLYIDFPNKQAFDKVRFDVQCTN